MASTNKTTNYELSQYIGTDKPTYLTDYNQDMAKIDAGIHAAKVEADTNATNIGDLTSLTTTAKTSAVAAINELDSDLGTLNTTVGNHTTAIADNTSHIGDLTGLTTTAKTNLVAAVNEVDSQANTNTSNIGTLSGLETNVKTNLVAAINEIVNKFNFVNFVDISNNTIATTGINGSISRKTIKLATNNDYSIIKLYGSIGYTAEGYTSTISIANAIPSGYRPSSDIVVNSCGVVTSSGASAYALNCDVTFKADGSILITVENGGWDPSVSVQLVPCLIFLKDFGDVPTPPTN